MHNKLILGLMIVVSGCVAAETDDSASLTWTEREATLEHDGTSTVFAHADELGVWTVDLPQEATSKRILELVELEQQEAARDGIVLPWQQPVASPGLALRRCDTRSTWVWGGDCSGCVNNLENTMLGTTRSTSCSEGVVYSTCSVTSCY